MDSVFRKLATFTTATAIIGHANNSYACKFLIQSNVSGDVRYVDDLKNIMHDSSEYLAIIRKIDDKKDIRDVYFISQTLNLKLNPIIKTAKDLKLNGVDVGANTIVAFQLQSNDLKFSYSYYLYAAGSEVIIDDQSEIAQLSLALDACIKIDDLDKIQSDKHKSSGYVETADHSGGIMHKGFEYNREYNGHFNLVVSGRYAVDTSCVTDLFFTEYQSST